MKIGNGSYCATKKDYEEKASILKGKCDGESLKSPIITGYGDVNQEVSLKGEYVFPNVIATDYRGNTIDVKKEIRTNNVLVDEITTTILNQTYTIIYTAVDENTNLSSSVTVTLKVVDKESPIIEVLGKTEDQTVNEEASATKTYVIPTATIKDNSGEELTPVISGSVNLEIPDTYQIKYTATDSSGNTKQLTLTVIVKDNKKPTIDYTLNPGSPDGLNNWYKRDITVNLSGTDDGTGIKEYEYALNTGGTYGTYQKVTGTNFILSTEAASMQFKVRSKDGVGNTSEEKESTIVKLDKTKPVITSTTLDPNTWTSGSVKVTVSGTDNLSGIKEYSFDEGLTWITENNKSFSSNQNVKVMIKDSAGNTSISSSIVIDQIETVKPTVEFAIVGTPFNSNGWANSNFNINVIPHVGSSGLKSYKYCTTGGSTCSPNIPLTGTSQTVTIVTESATNKICVEAIDNASSTSGVVCSSNYKLDKTAPSAPTSMGMVYADWSIYSEGAWSNRAVYMGTTTSAPGPVGATDATSGIWKYQISDNNSTFQDYVYSGSGIYQITIEGTTYRYFRAVDQAGNVGGSLTKTIKIDQTAPVINNIVPGTTRFNDSNFSSGLNSVVVYNNLQNGTVTHERLPMATPVGSYALKIVTNGEAAPANGGFVHYDIFCKENGQFVHRFIAKVPTNQTVTWASNNLGLGYSVTWLTDTKGTGDWKEYAYLIRCGTNAVPYGTFSHVYLEGPQGTSSFPVTWYVAYSDVFDKAQKAWNLAIPVGIFADATDNYSGIVGYGINQSSTTPPNFTSIASQPWVYHMFPPDDGNRTYYIWFKDGVGNMTARAIVVDQYIVYTMG